MCIGIDVDNIDANTLYIDQRMGTNGEAFGVNPGASIVIQLSENPSTGYLWELVSVDEQVVALQNTDFIIGNTELIGSGGVRSYYFQAISVGETSIKLVYQRSWEETAIENFEVLIRVEEAQTTDDTRRIPMPDSVEEIMNKTLAEYSSDLAATIIEQIEMINERIQDKPGEGEENPDQNTEVTPIPTRGLIRSELLPVPEVTDVEDYIFGLLVNLSGATDASIDFEGTTVGEYTNSLAQNILLLMTGMTDVQKRFFGFSDLAIENTDEMTALGMRIVSFIEVTTHTEFIQPIFDTPESETIDETIELNEGSFYCPALGIR